MRKILVILLICGIIFAGYGISWVAAEDAEDTMCIPMGTILIEPPSDVDAKRSSVEFPHSTHFDYTCKTCHHTWDGETPVLSCTTSGCHDLTRSRSEDGKVDPELAVRNYKNAFHGSCIGCHKNIKAQNSQIEKSYSLTTPLQSSGPTSCNDCHPKE
jgi:hypothetical protein